MKTITSHENQIYKKAAQLGIKKFRDKQSRYLIEGPNLVWEALNHDHVVIHTAFFRSGLCGLDEEKREKILSLLTSKEIETFEVTDKLFDRFCSTETPQGVVAVVEKPFMDEEHFFHQTRHHNGNIVVFDRLQDPGNIGTILRTADGAGYQGAIMIKGSADIYAPKIVRAAAGTLFRLPLMVANSPQQAIEILKQYGKKVVCTVLQEAKNYYECPLTKDVAIILGNEGNGVCEEFVNNSDLRVTIPMKGSLESLNVAVAAGILIYESVRK